MYTCFENETAKLHIIMLLKISKTFCDVYLFSSNKIVLPLFDLFCFICGKGLCIDMLLLFHYPTDSALTGVKFFTIC